MNPLEVEAKETWGQTSAYREYEKKTRGYSTDQWKDLAAGTDSIMAAFALCRKEGKTPDSQEAQTLVQALQDHITENYYLCTKEILAGLGQMYVGDARFQSNIDKHGEGTAAFICEATQIYCKNCV